jgi:hypothetical protein
MSVILVSFLQRVERLLFLAESRVDSSHHVGGGDVNGPVV